MNKELQKDTPFKELMDARLRMQGDNAHHLELVCDHEGVSWINHSIATTVDLTWYALRDLSSSVILIIGGIDKGGEHHKLKELVNEKVETIICLGTTPWIYTSVFKDDVKLMVTAPTVNDAVKLAGKLITKETKTILFSPSCPSYDAFDNYRNRGDKFKISVKEHVRK